MQYTPKSSLRVSLTSKTQLNNFKPVQVKKKWLNYVFAVQPCFIKSVPRNLHIYIPLKGTVSVISKEPPIKDDNARFTTGKPFLIKISKFLSLQKQGFHEMTIFCAKFWHTFFSRTFAHEAQTIFCVCNLRKTGNIPHNVNAKRKK